MEDIWEEAKKRELEKKTQVIRIDRDLANRLEKMNKGSYNKAIEYLLNINPEKNVLDQIKIINEDISKLQEAIQRLVQLNGLRV